MQNKIQVAIYDHTPVFADFNKYVVNDAANMFQRFALWIGRKVGVIEEESISKQIGYKTTEIDLSDIGKAITEQIDFYNRRNQMPKCVLVGNDFGRQIMQAQSLGIHNFAYNVPNHLSSPYGLVTAHRAIFGLEIIVIPTISGAIVLPDLDR